MIAKVKIRGFRALGGIDVRLRPLTVLLGPNDSGKTSFLEAIHRGINDAFTHEDFCRFERGRAPDVAHPPPHVELKTDTGIPFVGGVELFKLPSEGIPMESVGVADEPGQGAPRLEVTGANLAAFLEDRKSVV